MTEQTAAEQEAQMEQVAQEIKKGFSLKERLENRGLRRAKVTLYLDENAGARHKAVADRIKAIQAEVDDAQQERDMADSVSNEAVKAQAEQKVGTLVAERATLTVQVMEMEKELERDSLAVSLRAVPAKIAKDCRRRAKVSCDITGKDIPEDKMEEFVQAYNAHLMSLTVVSITDNSTGGINEGLSYQDANDLIDFLPPGQYERLSRAMNEVQFRDAFSETLEVQEDFS